MEKDLLLIGGSRFLGRVFTTLRAAGGGWKLKGIRDGSGVHNEGLISIKRNGRRSDKQKAAAGEDPAAALGGEGSKNRFRSDHKGFGTG